MKNNKLKEKLINLFFLSVTLTTLIFLSLICFFLIKNGGTVILNIGIKKFIFGNIWKPENNIFGIFPMIIGSLYLTIGALILGVPIGILTAIYMVYYCNSKLYKFFYPAIELMAGIPSIIYGFFGLVVIVPIIFKFRGISGKGLFTSSILLGIMILPTIINITESTLKQVPKNYYEGALALGVSKEVSIFKVVIPAGKSGIMASIILGLGRAIGEATAVLLVAGNQSIFPKSIFSGIRTLTTNVVLEMGYAQDLHREALIGTSLILFIFILIINLSFSFFKYKRSL